MNGKIFYVGDPEIELLDWVNAFSVSLTGKPARIVPTGAVKVLAKIGDVVKAAGGSFPIFSSRYRSMTEPYETPIEKTFEVFGKPSYSLEDGVRITTDWLRTQPEFKERLAALDARKM